jgi:phosphatidylinositol-3-phosphatase
MKAAAALLLLCALPACPAAATAVTPAPAFEHVVVIVFENKESTSILGNRVAPTFNHYARRYANLTRYFGVTHPSLPNYLALVSGSTHGITSDCTSCVASGKSLADTIEESGRTWKTYAEGLPSAGFLGPSSRRYAKKHDPFAYFPDVSADPRRRARIVPLTRLAVDLSAGTLPDFSLVVPDLCHSMHDCPVGVGDAWLRRIAPPLLSLPNSVVFVVFDEGGSSIRGGGHTVALALGTAIRRHTRFTRVTNHYGLLRTIEQAWGLPLLGRSAGATPVTGIWR